MVEFVLFGVTLLAVAVSHHHALRAAVTGLVVVTAYKMITQPGGFHLVAHLGHEGRTLINIFGLIVGFELLADHFRQSRLGELLPRWLPDDWRGGFALLCVVFGLSIFLDNIAAAVIGGSIASVVFQRRVHLGFLAAIVAASNAGGAGSVVGDTTTTMMWIAGLSPLVAARAFLPAFIALVSFGVPASMIQDRHQRIMKDAPEDVRIDWGRLGVVGLVLVGAIVANILVDLPALGVWAALLAGTRIRKPNWKKIPHAMGSATFLLSLVTVASMMPVRSLPAPSFATTLGIGVISSVFDNIPLTALAIRQGGYDWGALAFAVGFGGSMMWFGSSAGVALSNDFEEARDAVKWLRSAWFVPVAYVIAMFVSYALLGWHPSLLRS